MAQLGWLGGMLAACSTSSLCTAGSTRWVQLSLLGLPLCVGGDIPVSQATAGNSQGAGVHWSATVSMLYNSSRSGDPRSANTATDQHQSVLLTYVSESADTTVSACMPAHLGLNHAAS